MSHGSLEGALRDPEGDPIGAAVLCHPHPLHGGTMHTKAVFRAAQALNEAGLRVLRFNFRGVGTSTGSYGEGSAEVEDVRAALDFLEERSPGLPLVAGGFSFGAHVGARVAVDEDRVRAILAMGLPVSMYDFSYLAGANRPVLVVQGEEDEFGSGEAAEAVVRELGPHVTIERIPQSDHFFHDRFDELKEAIYRYFTEGPGARVLAPAGGTDRSGEEGGADA